MKMFRGALPLLLMLQVACASHAVQGEQSAPPAAVTATFKGDAARPEQAQGWVRSELYFGVGKEAGETPANPVVGETQWRAFLDKEVTPRFPDGLTWLDVNGQWRGPSGGPEPMPSRLLIVLHADNPHNEQALQDIARNFHARFGTHVLVASQAVRARDADWTEQRIQGNPQLSPTPD